MSDLDYLTKRIKKFTSRPVGWEDLDEARGYWVDITAVRDELIGTIRSTPDTRWRRGGQAALTALELERRVERAMAQAVADGQARGLVRKRGQARGRALRLPAPRELLPMAFPQRVLLLSRPSPPLWEQALAQATEQADLSRANVQRLIDQAGEQVVTVSPRARRGGGPDTRRLVEQTATSLAGLASGLAQLDVSELDGFSAEQINEWRERLAEGRLAVGWLDRELKRRGERQ